MNLVIPDNARVSKIYPAKDARRNAYPFTVYLAYINGGSTTHICSGSLINRQWVLTAAHCLDIGATHVVLGAYDRSKTESTTQTIDIAEEIPYPGYNPGNNSFDAGLIRLARRANIRSEAVGVVSLVSSEKMRAKFLTNTKTCKVLGWGLVKYENGWFSAVKQQEQNIRWVTVEEAEDRGYFVGSGVLPSEADNGNECEQGAICFGDSGGPLVCKQGGQWIQMAITSYLWRPEGCILGVKFNADVIVFYDWISAIAGLEI